MSLYYFCNPCQAVTKDYNNLVRHLSVKHPFHPTDIKSQDDLIIQRQRIYDYPLDYTVEINDDYHTLFSSEEESYGI